MNYDFSIKDDLNTIEYSSLDTIFDFHNFRTQFNFLQERGVLGNTDVLENKTKYNFDETNSLSFSTRRNRNLNLTEYYDLIYEYKNDCLIAGIQYKKNYYNDADIKPEEELFFSITLIPLATFSPDKMILK
jgi:LPS-assembly protein